MARAGQRPGPRTDHEKTEIRRALLGVYYASLGRRFELRGAPSVLLPPEARPPSLAESLARLQNEPELHTATWRLLRSVPVRSLEAHARVSPLQDYPPELVRLLGADAVRDIDERRRRYRTGAYLLVAALSACAQGHRAQFDALHRLLQQKSQLTDDSDFHRMTEPTLGADVVGVLQMLADNWEKAPRELTRLQDDVGLELGNFVLDLADAAALLDSVQFRSDGGSLDVYPVSSVISQESGSLVTTATVTTVVQGDYETLRRALDPQHWAEESQVVTRAVLVDDMFVRTPNPPGNGEAWSRPDEVVAPRLLEEDASLQWGEGGGRAEFNNVLRIERQWADDEKKDLEVRFCLARSISSRVLWDARPGGIAVDEGYLKARRLSGEAQETRWRVTSRKRLLFSDRTPRAGGWGWVDVGQALNYLTPAALAWWLESETYSLGAPRPRQPAPVHDDTSHSGAPPPPTAS